MTATQTTGPGTCAIEAAIPRSIPLRAGSGSNLPAADHLRLDTRVPLVGGGDKTTETGTAADDPAKPIRVSQRAGLGPILDDPTLRVLAEAVDDLESVRKANENRLRQLTRCEADADGIVRGHCLPDDSKTVARLRVTLDLLAEAERHAVKNLEATMAAHPLGPWIKATNGLGLKTIARLLSAVGDPAWNTLHDRPRTVSELWAYCGLAVIDGRAQRHRKGERSNWSDTAKMRVWNCVQPIVKNARSPYRHVYDAARAASKGALYDERFAGRKGHGGTVIVAGDPIPDGHLHARAVRVVMKAILRDLWIEAQRIHDEIAEGSKADGTP